MIIKSYRFCDVDSPGWSFQEVELGKMNLLVGDSGAGKTRFLNTLFNLARMVSGTRGLAQGQWELRLSAGASEYAWTLAIRTRKDPETGNVRPVVVEERLSVLGTDGQYRRVLSRQGNRLTYNNQTLPKLTQDAVSFRLLRDEEEIRPLYGGFSSMRRREFSDQALARAREVSPLPRERLSERIRVPRDLFYLDTNLNNILCLMAKHFPDVFAKLVSSFIDVFSTVEDLVVMDASDLDLGIDVQGIVWAVAVRERGLDRPIPVWDLSSGMQKVLLIVADILLLPEGGIYLIDEYENSLGLSAIDFLPGFIAEEGGDKQFFITSHHPYLINHVPVKDWYVFCRNGMDVAIRYGQDNVDKYGRSRQQRFVQLINDPFYNRSLERSA